LHLTISIPFIKDNKDAIKLPTFRGKAPIVASTSSEATSSKPPSTRDGKDFAWSRGLGIELSPLKTRSSRKKLAQDSSELIESVPSPTDNGPLRAMKALVREK
jgi:hypothetical protein